MSKILFSILFLLCFATSVFANPISQEEAQAWVDRIRIKHRLSADFDVKAYFEQRAENISEKLQYDPSSKFYQRDLADAFHSLGHLAENEHQYEIALAYQKKALNLYLLSGERAGGSWNDGVEHAYEHIFMDHYDQAILFLQRGEMSEAVAWFTKAFRLLSDSPEVYNDRSRLGRVNRRERSFVNTQSTELKNAVNFELQKLGAQPARLLCKNLFP